MPKPKIGIGPRFALRSNDPAKVKACIRCVYGNGEHAEWCEKAKLIEKIRQQFQIAMADIVTTETAKEVWTLEVLPELENTRPDVLNTIFEKDSTRVAVNRFLEAHPELRRPQ